MADGTIKEFNGLSVFSALIASSALLLKVVHVVMFVKVQDRAREAAI